MFALSLLVINTAKLSLSLTHEENSDTEDQTLFTASNALEEKEDDFELSAEERERMIDELEITLGASAALPDTAIIEVNSKGQSLTKTEYILCRKTRMKIDADILERTDVDIGLQEKCIDILNFQEPDYTAIKRAQDAEEQQQVDEYYTTYKEFKDLKFEKVEIIELTKEAKEHDITGYLLDDKKYILDIVTCEESHNGCYLKINGKNIGLLQSGSSYAFGENKEYTLEITSIEYNVCGKRFCDYGYDTYDVVNYKIIKRNAE
ncbi:hypothetical protein HYS50_02570 [Candidatus Woesearchaeota archaeon]|nr:hypothetical protein [Candidatus Woesearchaeota archaeon]